MPAARSINKIVSSKSKAFMAFCFCFIVGAAISSAIDWPHTPSLALPLKGEGNTTIGLYLFISLFFLLFLGIIFWRKKITCFFVTCLFFLILGVCRFTWTIPDCSSPNQVCYYNDRSATIIGRVSSEPNIQIDKAQYTIDVFDLPRAPALKGGGIAASSPFKERTVERSMGRVLLTNRIYPEYNYGDTLKIECKLQTPTNQDGATFNYQKYLAKDGIYSLCSFPKNVAVCHPRQNGDPAGDCLDSRFGGNDRWRIGRLIMSQILNLKSKIKNQINSLWPEPESSLMAGLLYGSKSTLPPELTNDFTRTGLTHIIAVSGFNITIIATVLMSMLIFVGLWRKQAYWIVMVTLFLFVLFTGATGSVVRAAIMGALVLTARQIGRLSQIGNVLVFTASIMVAINPYVLLWDAGFQLSFLATLGLVYLSPLLEEKFIAKEEGYHKTGRNFEIKKLRNFVISKFPNFLISTLVQTLSAIIATLPLILYQFGRLSIVAPLVNVLILWIIPWLMLGGFIALIVSFIFFSLGQIVGWVSLIGLKYVILIVRFFGQQSWAAMDFRLPLWGMILMYVVLFAVILRASHLNCHPELVSGSDNLRD